MLNGGSLKNCPSKGLLMENPSNGFSNVCRPQYAETTLSMFKFHSTLSSDTTEREQKLFVLILNSNKFFSCYLCEMSVFILLFMHLSSPMSATRSAVLQTRVLCKVPPHWLWKALLAFHLLQPLHMSHSMLIQTSFQFPMDIWLLLTKNPQNDHKKETEEHLPLTLKMLSYHDLLTCSFLIVNISNICISHRHLFLLYFTIYGYSTADSKRQVLNCAKYSVSVKPLWGWNRTSWHLS